MDSTKRSVDVFCEEMKRLLEMERAEEVAETEAALKSGGAALERKGVRLRHLVVADVGVGVGGRTCVTLCPRGGNLEEEGVALPAHRFGCGDTVRMTRMDKIAGGTTKTKKPNGNNHDDADADDDWVDGVVSRVKRTSLVVTLGKEVAAPALVLQQLDLIADETTFKRMRKAMNDLEASTENPIRQVLFGDRAPRFLYHAPSAWKPFDPSLNATQHEAVSLCLQSQDVAVIHGPPGTGKTTTVAEVIKQYLSAGLRVLACAPSNIAVDNLLEKLSSFNPEQYRPVRLGHPARLLPSVLRFCLENVLEQTDNAMLCRDIRKEMLAVSRRQDKTSDRQERKDLRAQFRILRKELSVREKKALAEVLTGSRLVMATLTGCADRLLRDVEPFDVVVIDEAAQAMEPACWIALLKGKRVVLAGDHMQLPPTITSVAAAKQGLATTLLDRVVTMLGDRVTRMLQVQYRMHTKIMNFSSHEFYHDKLVAAPSVASHLLKDIVDDGHGDDGDADDQDELLDFPMVFVDTAGCHLHELQEEAGSSRENQGEALLVAKHVADLCGRGVNQTDVAVITPYNAQVARIRGLLATDWPKVEVGSVDGFQGREKEAIVISLVRSNAKRDVGFLSDFRRLNVAITRARRHVCVFGDSVCISSDPYLKKLVAYAEEHGDYRSARSDMSADVVGVMKELPAASKPPPPPSSTRRVELATPSFRVQTEAKIRAFKEGHERKLLMPASLNSAQRRMVHEIAAELQLYHLSMGEGDDRAICVSKDPFVFEEEVVVGGDVETVMNSKVTVGDGNGSDNGGGGGVVVVAHGQVPIVVDDVVPALAPASAAVVPKKKKKSNKKKDVAKTTPKKKKNQHPPPPASSSMEDIDLDKEVAAQKHGKCHHAGCNESTDLLSFYTSCQFCKYAFCTHHHLAEVHGCGVAATAAARKEFVERHKQAANPTQKPLSPEKRDLVRKMLHKKIDKVSHKPQNPKKK